MTSTLFVVLFIDKDEPITVLSATVTLKDK